MATPKKTYPYAIYYNDGSYMIYDLTQDDYDHLKKTLTHTPAFNTGGLQYGSPVSIELSIGLISLKDIRSVIKQKPPEKPKKNESAIPELTTEEIEWVVANREAWKQDEGGYNQ